jgi:dissimilatory sulfite reductase (desulfoviridin) alpha/beta subunit
MGYHIQVGGKLGRHPQLAHELPGLYDAATTLDILKACIEIYKSKSQNGERFGQVLQPSDVDGLGSRFSSFPAGKF